MEQIYRRYDKDSFWERTLDKIFEKIMAHPSLGLFFRNKDICHIKHMNNMLLEIALTNDDTHFPVSLSRVHKPLQISNQTFEDFIGIYYSVLKETPILDSDIEVIMSVVISYKTNIVS